jgi:hypothetical protein
MSVAEQIFAKAQVLPEPAQKTVLDLVEKLAKQNAASQKSTSKAGGTMGRVQLPLIDSKEPGVLDLTNADIEELLA